MQPNLPPEPAVAQNGLAPAPPAPAVAPAATPMAQTAALIANRLAAMQPSAGVGAAGNSVASMGMRNISPAMNAQNLRALQNAYQAQLTQNMNGMAMAGLARNGALQARGGPVAMRQPTNVLVNGRASGTPTAGAAYAAAGATTQKRKYTPSTARYNRPVAASPAYKYARAASGTRAPTNNYKNQLHAQDAAAKYKAAYNNAGPAIVNLVENAAAYFEGKDTPEALRDKERSFERYVFNVDMLSEIFEGPLPNDKDGGGTRREAAKQREQRVAVLQRIGGRMLSRTHEERMAELDAYRESYEKLAGEHRRTEKGSMRLFQKLDRAKSTDELRRLRAEYEQLHGVKFVDFPAPMVKRELDRTLPQLKPKNTTKIIQFP